MAETEAPLKTYRGNCHCGAFVYEVTMPEIKKVGECDCSICVKKGYIYEFADKNNFKVVKGSEDELTSYTFGPKTMVHKVCLDDGWSGGWMRESSD
jgi:hypothetical protein